MKESGPPLPPAPEPPAPAREHIREFPTVGPLTEDYALAQADGRPLAEIPDSHLVLLRRRFNRNYKRSRTSEQKNFFETWSRNLGAEIRRRQIAAVAAAAHKN